MSAIGVHHIALSVNDWDKSEEFYKKLADALGAKPIIETEGGPHRNEDGKILIFAGNRFMFSIWEALPENKQNKFKEYNVGLHHFAFEAPSREAVDELYQVLLTMNAEIVDAPAEYDYVPGFYAIFFRDPNGIRLEYAHVPA